MLNYDLFRVVVAPEYAALSNATLDIFAAEAEIEISVKAFGKRYPRAVALITAHLINMSKRSEDGSSSSSGELKKIKVGDLEREFAVSSADSKSNGSYNLTTYGKEFLRLRKQSLMGPKFVGC